MRWMTNGKAPAGMAIVIPARSICTNCGAAMTLLAPPLWAHVDDKKIHEFQTHWMKP